MKKVGESDYKRILRYLKNRAVDNVYILGDIQSYGISDDSIELFYEGDADRPDFLLMRFFQSYVISAEDSDFSVDDLKKYFSEKTVRCISGFHHVVAHLDTVFQERRVIESKMMILRHDMNKVLEEPSNSAIQRLVSENSGEIQDFYCRIPEFFERFYGNDGMKRIYEQFKNGAFFGLFEGKELVTVAALSATTDSFGMIDDVATLEEYQRRGYAYRLLSYLCGTELREKDFLCVYCDDLRAEKLYRKLQFEEYGQYDLIYPVKKE